MGSTAKSASASLMSSSFSFFLATSFSFCRSYSGDLTICKPEIRCFIADGKLDVDDVRQRFVDEKSANAS